MPTRIAVAGKGGTGKTTIAATWARTLARRGRNVLAIDADSNPNLANVLGVTPEHAREIVGLPRNLMERRTLEDGTTKSFFVADPEDVLRDYTVTAPDNVRLLVMGKVGHGGAG
jgi:CO dehydrogenase maturation factor